MMALPQSARTVGHEEAASIFSDAYGEAQQTAQESVPVLILLAREVALHAGADERCGFGFGSPLFDLSKSLAHVAVALYTTTANTQNSGFADSARARLQALRTHLVHYRAAVFESETAPPETDRQELEPLLHRCSSFVEQVLEGGRMLASERAAFAAATGPMILRLTEVATCHQIDALHEAVERALATLTTEQRARLQVVVVGDHQARSRSLGMQYFELRFGEPAGEEERVTYGENLTEEKAALELVGTRRLDRAIARAFFNDEKRLQRDVLGDAAKTCLARLKLAPIG